MLCFRDMTFCSASKDDCVNVTCPRHFGEDDKAAADAWWARFKMPDEGPPIAWSYFKEGCAIYMGAKEMSRAARIRSKRKSI